MALEIYGDYVTSSGDFVAHGFELGSEDQWATYWGAGATRQGFDFDYERYFLYNSTWDWTQYTDAVVSDSRRINPGQATADSFDISPYYRRGGKILMYHGLSDGLIQPDSSVQFYNATMAATGQSLEQMRNWYRHFEVPGMQHCWFSNRYNAPWDFAGAGVATQMRLLPNLGVGLPAVGAGWSVPGHLGDPAYDALSALMRWVENGTAVNKVVATAFNSDFSTYRTRPICPWPSKAVYNKTGDINNAANWYC
jgi:feruloyl esterase